MICIKVNERACHFGGYFSFNNSLFIACGIGFKAMASKAGRDPKSIALAHVVLWPVAWEAESAISGGRRTLTGSTAEMLQDIDVLAKSGVGDVCVSFHGATVAEMVARMERFAGEMLAKIATKAV